MPIPAQSGQNAQKTRTGTRPVTKLSHWPGGFFVTLCTAYFEPQDF
jgi:hypothetical protein